MVALGLVLIVVGLIAVLAALFVSEGSAELLGMDLTALTIFLVGLGAGICLLWGFVILKWGTRRSIAARKERHELRRQGGQPATPPTSPDVGP
ncbi:hypothetical protein [Nocardioides jishulii]|uniref:Uncharacterized protein n=1 Tax=Nocardioides jishulii TaxID=2575440 RepID=A0A4U2YSB0_9ACTN|nr:hypothetical protein [Nocardioides jishulii]QCX28776.1 hypothetical protein FCL41_15510 [Nocardioides jishulii]TKI64328.1 hypothetical protein FC770_04060 [Nocardioides jishulii]